MRKLIVLAALAALAPLAAHAQGRATTKDAERMVHKAAEFLKKEGKLKALQVFNDPKGPFTYQDLYMIAYDLEGNCLAHGANKARVGKNFLHDKDPDGKEFVRERVEIAKNQGKGWQEYRYLNPSNNKVEVKVAYIELVDGVILICGAYKQ
jgi:cytochrome c